MSKRRLATGCVRRVLIFTSAVRNVIKNRDYDIDGANDTKQPCTRKTRYSRSFYHPVTFRCVAMVFNNGLFFCVSGKIPAIRRTA